MKNSKQNTMVIFKKHHHTKEKRRQFTIQSLFTETSITYKKCNESISSENTSKNKYLQEIPENTFFKIHISSTPITKPFPETIYAFKPKKPNLEFCNSSKMLIALFGEMKFFKIYDKYRKKLKENKKHDKDTIASYKKVAAEIEVKLKIRECELIEKVNDIETFEKFLRENH